jgi:hypothetical protein
MPSPYHRLLPIWPQFLAIFAAIFVPFAAFLSFAIQPLVGRWFLPVFGGSATVWVSCTLFFQIALLLGYLLAGQLIRLNPRQQIACLCILSIAAISLWKLPNIAALDNSSGFSSALFILATRTLPAVVLLFTFSQLFHAWFRDLGRPVPYLIYGVSNVGSLLALLAYPLWLEPILGLTEQAFFWHGLIIVAITGLIITAWFQYLYLKSYPASTQIKHKADPASNVLSKKSIIIWLLSAALAVIVMLGANQCFSAELGSGPLAWIGPLGVYLLSFICVFSSFWPRWLTIVFLPLLSAALIGYMLTKGFTVKALHGYDFIWPLSLSFFACCVAHALAYSRRPIFNFPIFYLTIAIGGALGTLLYLFITPQLLSRPIELPIAALIILLIAFWFELKRFSTVLRASAITLIVAIVVFIGIRGIQPERGTRGGHLIHERNIYGHSMLKIESDNIVLSSETTTHGSQLTGDPSIRKHPTLYYTESSAVGRVIQELKQQRPSLRIGVVGLGAGTLAAYARPSDHYDFWEIDPKSIRIADTYFTYLSDSEGTCKVHLLDGRRGLATTHDDYDLIVVDAFAGDGIPTHLVTSEALRIYTERLKVRDGLLVIHISSRNHAFFPTLAATAFAQQLNSLFVRTDISKTSLTLDLDWDPARTDYVVIGKDAWITTLKVSMPESEDEGRVKRIITAYTPDTTNGPLQIWTDELTATKSTFNLDFFLSH